MTDTKHLTHHERTLMLWEAMGRKPVTPRRRESERRRRLRLLIPNAVCRLDILSDEEKKSIEVTVRDVNVRGASLLSAVTLPVDQVVRLYLPAGARSAAGAVEARVAYCRKTLRDYRIGVKFCRSRAAAQKTP